MAAAHLSEASELSGGDHRLWLELARYQRRTGDREAANVSYRRAIATAPARHRAGIAKEAAGLDE